MQSGWVEIFFLAMLAGFIGLRLYHVLGRRTGHEKPVADPFRPSRADVTPSREALRAEPEPVTSLDIPADVPAEVRRGLEAIHGVDRQFSFHHFLTGAHGAYTMVLESFWRGDLDPLKDIVSDEILMNFRAAVEQRRLADERLDNRLLRVARAQIVAASLNGMMAEITVRFDAEILSVTRDAEGRLIAGNADQPVETHDLWTFSRHSGSQDPSWLLIATDEEA